MFSIRTVLILFLCLFVLSVECGGGGGARSSGGGYAKSSSGGGKSAKSPGAKGFLGEPVNGKHQNSAGSLPKNKTGGRFLSAWGIISIIMLVIVGSALIYYTSIFYPLVCAERGKYDVMEMTAV